MNRKQIDTDSLMPELEQIKHSRCISGRNVSFEFKIPKF
jgi:hypothetical protein